MINDREELGDPSRWPGGRCCVKSIAREPRGFPKYFGVILSHEPLKVLPPSMLGEEEAAPEVHKTYASLDDLLKVWIVD